MSEEARGSAAADWGVFVPLPEDGDGERPAHGPARAPRRPSRAVLVVAVVAIAAAVVVIALFAFGGGGSPNASIVSNAAATTGGEPGFRFALVEEITLAGQRARITAGGTYMRLPQTEARMSLTENGTTVTARVIGSDEYIRRGPGSWAKLDLAAFEQTLGVSSQGLVSQDPSQLLSFLLSTGSVTRLGVQPVRGVSATHYRAVVALPRVAAASPPAQRAAARQEVALLERLTRRTTLPIDAWIDGNRLVRRLEITLPSVCTKSGTFHETITLDYFGYGAQPKVQAPPEGQVTDVTNQAEASLRQQMQEFCGASQSGGASSASVTKGSRT